MSKLRGVINTEGTINWAYYLKLDKKKANAEIYCSLHTES